MLALVLASISMALCAAAPLTAQGRTWIVDAAAGPGHHFTSLTPAIVAANSGDTVIVRSGIYVEPAPLIVDHALSIVGEGDPVVTVSAPATPSAVPYTFRVRFTAASETVAIVGLVLATPTGEAGGVSTSGCGGPVTLQDLSGPLSSGAVPTAARLRFSSCARFHLDGLRGVDGRLEILDSNGTITDCALQRPSIRIDLSNVEIDRSSFDNAGRTTPFQVFDLAFCRVDISRSTITSLAAQSGGSAPAVYGITAFLNVDPTTTISAPPGQQPVDGAVSVGTLELVSLTSSIVSTPLGTGIDIEVLTTAGATVGTFLSLPTPVPSPTAPALMRELWIDPQSHLVLDVATPIGRLRNLTIPLGVDVPAGLTTVVQTVSLGPSLRLSNGTVLVFR